VLFTLQIGSVEQVSRAVLVLATSKDHITVCGEMLQHASRKADAAAALHSVLHAACSLTCRHRPQERCCESAGHGLCCRQLLAVTLVLAPQVPGDSSSSSTAAGLT
jgi:hypothetical protein